MPNYAPILVVSLNYRQAVYWILQEYPGLPRSEWKFANTPEQIMGYRGPAIKFVGQWNQIPGFSELIETLRWCLAPGQTLEIENA